METFNIRLIINYMLFKVMSALSETFNYDWSDTLVEQELKELESRAAENYEGINHTFDNTLVVDGLRAKGF